MNAEGSLRTAQFRVWRARGVGDSVPNSQLMGADLASKRTQRAVIEQFPACKNTMQARVCTMVSRDAEA